MDHLISRLQRLNQQVESLKSKHQELLLQVREQESKALRLEMELNAKEQEMVALKEQNELIRMSGTLAFAEGDVQGTKLKINELVREIDKCIALLNG